MRALLVSFIWIAWMYGPMFSADITTKPGRWHPVEDLRFVDQTSCEQWRASFKPQLSEMLSHGKYGQTRCLPDGKIPLIPDPPGLVD